LHRALEQEARGDDELVAVVYSLLVVRLVVARGMRVVRIRLAVNRLRGCLQSPDLVFVESVVVELADVAYEPGLIAGLLRRRRLAAAECCAGDERRGVRCNACRNNPA